MNVQRGVAALPITLVLAFAVLLAAAFANRSVLLQVRSSVHQLHAAQAHEAAQAGLAWALAQLNRPMPIGEDCRPTREASATPWHEQASAGPLQASCVAQGQGWTCHCPSSGEPRSVADAEAAAFHIRLDADPSRPGRWELCSTGHGMSGGRAIELRMDIGRLPALDTQPSAALTVRGTASFNGEFALTHTDPASSGLTLQTGGSVLGTMPHLTSTPGTPAAASVASEDAVLSRLSAQGLHASVFRMNSGNWRQQPAAVTIDCHNTCDAALADAARHHTLIALEGGLRLAAAMSVGTAQRPVLLVADGPVELPAGATIHGLIYARHSMWTSEAPVIVHGAVIAESDLVASGPTQIHHDTAVLRTLQRRNGTYAPVIGSWRDL